MVILRVRNFRWPHGPLTAPELAETQASEILERRIFTAEGAE
jgi:hypothetical protein